MGADSTFKKYEITNLPNVAGDISSHTFLETATGIGTNATWSYKKVGKLYFGFWVADGGGGISEVVGNDIGGDPQDIRDTLDHLASLIGVTIDTYYIDQQINGVGLTGGIITWDGAQYNEAGGNNNLVAIGFLAN